MEIENLRKAEEILKEVTLLIQKLRREEQNESLSAGDIAKHKRRDLTTVHTLLKNILSYIELTLFSLNLFS